MGNDLLLGRPGHAIAWKKVQQRTFIGRQPGAYMPLDYGDDLLIKSKRSADLATHFSMADIVRHPAADIVKQSTGLDQATIYQGIGRVGERKVAHRPAVGDDSGRTPGPSEEIDTVLFTHSRGSP